MKLNDTGERFIPGQDHGGGQHVEHMARYMFAKEYVRGKKVLDVACGEGYGSMLLSKYGAREVVGVDLSEEAIRHAKNTYRHEGLAFQCASAEKLPFQDNTFEVVTSFETIEHLEGHARFLSEIKRVLGDDGLLLLSTPNREVYPRGNTFHIHEFTEDELVQALKGSFSHVRLYYQGSTQANVIVPKDTDGSIRNERISEKIESMYFFVLASNSVLPPPERLYVLSGEKSPRIRKLIWKAIRWHMKRLIRF